MRSSKGSIFDGLGFGRVEPSGIGRPGYHPKVHLTCTSMGIFPPRAIEPAPRARGSAQCRGDVACSFGWRLISRRFPISARTMGRRSRKSARNSSSCAAGWACCRSRAWPIDGSKFKAVNNRDKNFTCRKGGAPAQTIGGERRALSFRSSITADLQEPSETINLEKGAPERTSSRS